MAPSSFEAGWRSAILDVIKRRGGVFARSAAEFAKVDPDKDCVVLVRSVREARAISADRWVVLDGSLEDMVAAVEQKSGASPLKVYRFIAERLACASWLLERGAQRLPSAQRELELPGLGLVSRRDETGRPVSGSDARPLAFYTTVPPTVGASAEWPTEVFVFKDAEKRGVPPPTVDLTGRGRVVIFGPRFEMPAGHWRLTARFNVDTEDSDVYLRFQWGVGEDLETFEPLIQQSGDYEVSLERSWPEPGVAELRVWAANAHFLGRIEFKGGTVTLAGPPRRHASDAGDVGHNEDGVIR